MRKPRSLRKGVAIINNPPQIIMIFLVLSQLVNFCLICPVFCESDWDNKVQHLQKFSDYIDNSLLSQNSSMPNGSNSSEIKSDISQIQEYITKQKDSSFVNNEGYNNETSRVPRSTQMLQSSISNPTENMSLLSSKNKPYYMSFTQEEIFSMRIKHNISQDIDMDICKSGASTQRLT